MHAPINLLIVDGIAQNLSTFEALLSASLPRPPSAMPAPGAA